MRRLLQAARRVALTRDAIVSDLVASTGLSREGVLLALEHHLELEATDLELASLVAHAGDAPRVAVVLSANVFVAALRAIALARATAEEVIVKPSSREPIFVRALVAAADDPAIRIDDRLDLAAFARGEIHAYGRDETLRDIAARTQPSVSFRGFGSGMGIAVVLPEGDVGRAAARLTDDTVPFDQRGCSSPRVVVALGDERFAAALAEALHAELDDRSDRVPRGALDAAERVERTRYVETMRCLGTVLLGRQHVVGVGAAGTPLVLPPTGRHLHVASIPTPEVAREVLAPFSRAIVTVGSNDLARARSVAPPQARVTELGRMQRPPLDGPVDLRRMSSPPWR